MTTVIPSHYLIPPKQDTKKTLEEDEDQGDMDMIFFLCVTLFRICSVSVPHVYTNPDNLYYASRFEIVMTNLWAFFPIAQAQGLFLKGLLYISTKYLLYPEKIPKPKSMAKLSILLIFPNNFFTVM